MVDVLRRFRGEPAKPIRSVLVWSREARWTLSRFIRSAAGKHRFVLYPIWAQSIAMLVVAASLVATSYAFGIHRGMDKMFPGPLDARASQVASALADVAYGMNLRYAVHWTILSALEKGGLTDQAQYLEPLGLKYPDRIYDTALWNNLLDRAAHLEGISRAPKVSDKTLTFIQMEDLGMVDFFKISFRLFGYNVQGFFKTYFIILCVGICIFFLAFWTRPGILLIGNCLIFGITWSICALDALDAVGNGRFFPTLALIPALHVLALLWSPPRRTSVHLAAALGQVLLLAFIITMRTSASWTLLLFAASILFLFAKALWQCWAKPLSAFVRQALTWPAMLLIVTVVAFNVYHDGRTHPGYFALDETLPNHTIWNTLAVGLSLMPDIDEIAPELQKSRGDSFPTYLGNAYLKRIIGLDVPSVSAYYTNFLFPELGRPRTYERLVRAAYLDFIQRHPADFLRLTFITKPSMILDMLRNLFRNAIRTAAGYLLIATGLILSASLIIPAAGNISDLRRGSGMIVAMGIFSMLPYIVAYPAGPFEAFAVLIGIIAAGLAGLIWTLRWRGVRQVVSAGAV